MGAIARAGLGLPAAILAFAGVPAFAEEPEPEAAPAPAAELRPSQVDYMIVTGTRILRRDFDSASPIVTVMPEFFESVGAPTAEAALNRLPQFVPNFGSTSNIPGADGQAFVDLRGLGPTATLVLLDGRRIMPANGLGVVDINLIPPTLIERVEIVSGGASAVYGSDAVAGVVNFRLRQSFEGVELGGFYGRTDRGDGDQWDLNLTAGTDFAGGRGSVYGFVSRSERKLVSHGDRRFSRYAYNYVGQGNGSLGPGDAFVAGGSAAIEEGMTFLPTTGANPISQAAFDQVFAGYGYSTGTVPFQELIGTNNDGTVFTQGDLTPASVANYRGDQDPVLANDFAVFYNFAPSNALQLPLERTSAFGRLSYDVSDSLRLYADGLFGDYSVSQHQAPTPVFFVFVPPSNPYIPSDLALLLDSRPNPDAPVEWFKRISELGPRVADNDYSVYQGTFGVDGFLNDTWHFDSYVQYGETRQTRRQSGNALRSRIETLAFAPDGGLAACGGFDIFGAGAISPGCAEYIAVDARDKIELEQFIAEFSVEGPLAELPAGELRTAFGLMHKRDEFSYAADPVAASILPDGRQDIAGFAARDDISGDDHNTDLYIEALVPLLADRAGNSLLEAGLGYRHSQYNRAGGADAYKAELLYRPIDTLRIRGTYQHAIRAPSITELFAPQLPGFVSLGPSRDPCEAGSAARSGPNAAAVEALCVAQGLPEALLPTYRNARNLVGGFSGGNPDLEPEDVDTWTFGLVWTPTLKDQRYGRLQTAIDWYRIEVDNAVDRVSAAEILGLCFDPRVNPDLSAAQIWCTFFARNTESGDIEDMFAINRNLGEISTSGIDLQLDWQLPLGPGTLGVNWLVTWLDTFERGAGAGAQVEDLAGEISFLQGGTSLAEWRSLLSISYGWRNASVTARSRYIDSMRDTFVPEFRVPSRTYLDLYASYDFEPGLFAGLRLGFGIENVTDRDPPVYPSNNAANTDPQQYDVLGRRYFVTLNYRF
jgi:iron complex outermembrane recepter protein